MTAEPTRDVIIPTWNGSKVLADCLSALESEATPHSTIVVDNGSTDDTITIVKRRYPRVVVVELDKNLGFGAAVNRGVAAGRGEFVILLNNDANVRPGFLEEIGAPLADDESVGMVAGVLRIPGTNLIDAAGVEVDRGLAGFAFLNGCPIGHLDWNQSRLLGPCGGAAAFRREVYESLGGFDEELFAYSEDIDLALRARGAGWKCVLAPKAQADHVGSASLGLRTVRQTAIAARSRGYILGRWRPGPVWVFTELIIGAIDCLVLRSALPLTERVRGIRHGRSLPRHSADPAVLRPAMGWWSALRRRFEVVRGYERRRAR
jgi:N-acetylglucosaminyl-diphospho-decaprenol L-rhamnosyltransferase